MRLMPVLHQNWKFLFAYSLFAMLLCLPAPDMCRAGEPESGPVVDAVVVKIIDGPDNAQKLSRLARHLIVLEEGQPFSAQKLSQSIAALKRSGLFSAIDIPDPDMTDGSMDLVFYLKPFARIKNIRIHGEFPLMEREIHNAMTLSVGQACVPEKIREQKTPVESLLSREGYIRPRVSVSTKKDPGDGHCLVDVDIGKDRFYHVEAVRFEGNKAFSSARLKMRLSTWQSSLLFGGANRFVAEKLDQDKDSLKRFYRSKGYAEADIEAEVEKDPDTARVRVRFIISEGPRYRLCFEGNDAFWDMTLKKDAVLFTEGNKDGLGVRKSIRNMKKRYQSDGYLDVKINAEQTPVKQKKTPVNRICFVISEGPRHVVDSVSISGNSVFSDERIKKQMLTAPPGGLHPGQYVPEVLNEDVRAINALYVEAGYRNAGIQKTAEAGRVPDKAETIPVSVEIDIDEGPRTLVGQVSIKGQSLIAEESAVEMLEMQPGTPFRQYLVKTDQTTLAAEISELGYPHVTVAPRITVNPDQTQADITYRIEPGPRTVMGEVFFTGNFRTRRRILAREMGLGQGDAFSLSRAVSSQRNIRSLNVVDAARFEFFGLEEKAEQIQMLAEIREIRRHFAETGIGYDTRRQFYVNAAAGNRNMFGSNRELRAEVEWSQIGYRSDLNFFEQRFLGTRVSASAGLYTGKTEELNKAFGIRTHGATIGFSRLLIPGLTANLNFRYEFRDQYRTDNQPVPEEEADEYASRSMVAASPELVYTSTDSFLRPTRGVRATISVEGSKGLENDLDDFFKYRLDTRYYYTPLKRLTLAFHGRIGHIEPYGANDRVPEDQLFFLGGTPDVRGFSENKLRIDHNNDPVGGRTAILGSAEARFDLGMNFEAAVFYDTGAVRNSLKEGGSDDFRSSAGLGLRYVTPIGPIGVMYGWKLDREPGESPGAFHFAIGYTF